MNLTIFIFMLIALQFIYWCVARKSSKDVSDQQDYFLAGKKVQFFPLMMTFVGVIVGGGVVLGSADEAYLYGWPVLFYPLGGALGLMILGAGIGKRLAEFPVSTVAQIFEVVYQSMVLKKVTSILSMVSLFMILVGQIVASSKFFVSLRISSAPFFVLFWAVVIIYTVQGGLKAVISTDAAQASLFIVVFIICFAYVFYYEPMVSAIPMPRGENLAKVSSKLSGWLLMPLFFIVVEQDIAQRCFAGASPKIVSRAAFSAGIVTLVVSIVPVFFGMLAQAMQLEVPQGGSVLMSAIIATTNPILSALVGCAVLAAMISTATALINAISSNLSSDFNFVSLKSAGSLPLVRGITFLISIAAILFAFYFDNIVDILIQSYELSVSCLFIPIFIALFKKQGNFISALLAMLLGAFGFVFFRIYPIEFPKEIASILLSFAGFISGEVIAYFRQNLKTVYER
ncbi:MAG: sodium:solute symporter family protein [Parachlamydiaceae bacterium]|nr:sodium:solute symporter family protein [Parachlamydiaceae bacterium]